MTSATATAAAIANDTEPAAVEAPLNYLAPDSPPPVAYAYEPPPGVPLRSGRWEAQRVAIHDGRPIANELSLDKQGFTLRRRSSAVRDFFDEEEVKRVYYPEIERLVREETSASEVVIFDHTLRNSAEGRTGNTIREAAANVHNDYTEKSGPQRVHDLLAPAAAEARLKRRFVEINVWRPVAEPVEAWPLALCDAESLDPSDLVPSERRYPDRVGEIYAVRYNPSHRWYYFPRMRREEVVFIKCFDSARDGRARLSVHTAFADPTTRPDAPPRQSIEVRTLAFF